MCTKLDEVKREDVGEGMKYFVFEVLTSVTMKIALTWKGNAVFCDRSVPTFQRI
jgi:hypothetical protein